MRKNAYIFSLILFLTLIIGTLCVKAAFDPDCAFCVQGQMPQRQSWQKEKDIDRELPLIPITYKPLSVSFLQEIFGVSRQQPLYSRSGAVNAANNLIESAVEKLLKEGYDSTIINKIANEITRGYKDVGTHAIESKYINTSQCSASGNGICAYIETQLLVNYFASQYPGRVINDGSNIMGSQR